MKRKTLHYVAGVVMAGTVFQTAPGGGFEWATYLGGTAEDRPGWPNGLKIAANGDVFIIGDSWSENFPTTPDAYSTSCAGARDVVVSQLSADGSTLIWSTFLGGSFQDFGYALAFDAQGRVIVGGDCYSGDFPTTTDAYNQTHSGGLTDAWVAVLDPQKEGTEQLVYCTFLGGSGPEWDWVNDIVVLAPDSFLIAGGTSSPDFPTTMGAYDTIYNGGDWDAFVAVLNIPPTAEGAAQLAACTFLGGEGTDAAIHTVQDASGAIVVAGRTQSSGFPTTSGAYQETFGGVRDAFATRLDATLSTLVDSTYLGGPGDDIGNGMVLEPSGSIVLAGWAQPGFPVTAGAYNETFNGGSAFMSDNYVSRLSSDLTDLLASTYVGGSGDEGCNALALDPGSGALTVTGSVASTDYPTTPGSAETEYNGGFWDSFITRLDSDLSSLVYSTYVGGSGNVDYGYVIADDGARHVTVGCITNSNDAPATDGAYDTDHNGQGDMFIAQVDVCPWDLDGDGVVGILDFLDLLSAWGPNPGHPADLNGDGDVGILDFLALLGNWGACT